MSLATNLKLYRSLYDVTQDDLSEALGVERSTYTSYEAGKSLPTREGAQLLSGIFLIELDKLVDSPDELHQILQGTRPLFLEDSFDPFGSDDPLFDLNAKLSPMELSDDERKMLVHYRLQKAIEAQKRNNRISGRPLEEYQIDESQQEQEFLEILLKLDTKEGAGSLFGAPNTDPE
jgi:transcriptional regulator with XRE-family HTH domain